MPKILTTFSIAKFIYFSINFVFFKETIYLFVFRFQAVLQFVGPRSIIDN